MRGIDGSRDTKTDCRRGCAARQLGAETREMSIPRDMLEKAGITAGIPTFHAQGKAWERQVQSFFSHAFQMAFSSRYSWRQNDRARPSFRHLEPAFSGDYVKHLICQFSGSPPPQPTAKSGGRDAIGRRTSRTVILHTLLVVLEGVCKSCALPNRQAPTREKMAALYRFVSSCKRFDCSDRCSVFVSRDPKQL